MKKAKMLSLTASLVLAITFTLSCSDDNGDEGGDGDGNSSSSVVNGGGGSSSSGGGQGGGTSSGGDGGSSSSAVQCLDADSGTFTDDRDGKEYRYVTICSQTWFAENLNYDAEGSKCYGEGAQVYDPNNDRKKDDFKTLSAEEVQANCVKYGRLYDWETAKTACPSGWHLPSDTEWFKLRSFVGSNNVTKLKATSGWNNNGNGTDDYGFTALPGGFYDSEFNSSFYNVGLSGLWWSTRQDNARYAYSWFILGETGNHKSDLLSVRCVQD